MPVLVIIAFVVVFAAVLISVSVGMKFFEERRKRYVAGMLKTINAAPEVRHASILIDRSGKQESLTERLSARFNIKAQIQQAGLDWTPRTVFGGSAGAAAGGILIGMLFPVLVSRAVSCLTFSCVFAAMPFLILKRKRSKRMSKIEEQFPEALDFMARSMRGGHAFTISLEMLGQELIDPLGQEFRTLFNEQNLGAPIEVAFRNFTERVPLMDARFFASSVMLQRQTGGNLSEILARLSHVIRERFRLRGQVKAASSHGRMTAGILTGLPIATTLGLLVVAPGYLQGMAADPDGVKMIGGAIVAQLIGNYCIKRIVNIKV